MTRRAAGFTLVEILVSMILITIAAMAGQLFGAAYGVQALPDHRLARLEFRDELERCADGLFALQSGA